MFSLLTHPLRSPTPLTRLRLFTTTTPLPANKPLPPRLKIPETDLQETFLKGSGPGGQKINKTSSAVQLKHLPTGIVVKSQHTRSRDQNRKYARQILGERLDFLEKGDQSRVAIRTGRERTKKASRSKKTRRKYRKLEEEKAAAAAAAGEHVDEREGEEEEEDEEAESTGDKHGEVSGDAGGQRIGLRDAGKQDSTGTPPTNRWGRP